MAFRKKHVSGPEQRRAVRRTVRYPARVDAGDSSPAQVCILSDISQTGARIAGVAIPHLPGEFILLLGTVRRKCSVVWRNDKEMGVRFLPAE